MPDAITVEEGETVRIVVSNDRQLMHEFLLGTPEVHAEHAALIIRFANMEHDEPYMVHVAPGKTGATVWNFNYASSPSPCLIARRYQAGMVGKVRVVPRAKGAAAG